MIEGKAREAPKVARYVRVLALISPCDCFLSVFPAPFPAPFLSIDMRLSRTRIPPDITGLWKHATRLPVPISGAAGLRLNCGDRSAADRRVSRSFGAGNTKFLCQWEAQQVRSCGFVFHRGGTVHPYIQLVGNILGLMSPSQAHASRVFDSSPPSIPSGSLPHLLSLLCN